MARRSNRLKSKEIDSDQDRSFKEQEYLEISLEEGLEPESKKIKITNSDKNNKSERIKRLQIRRVYIFLELLSGSINSKYADNLLLQSLVLSIIPGHLVKRFTEILNSRVTLNAVGMLSTWWKNKFGVKISRSEIKESSSLGIHRLKYVLFQSSGYEFDIVLLFLCGLRALGLDSRLICSLQPAAVKAVQKTEETFVHVPSCWTEVKIDSKWVPVDCIRGLVDCRTALEMSSPVTKSNRQHLFIVAFNGNTAKDVTRRYCSQYYSQTLKFRKPDEVWFKSCLKLIDPLPCEPVEEQELSMNCEKEPMPTSAAAFKIHPKYVLESQIGKYEVVYPQDHCFGHFEGTGKSEKVFERKNVHKVRSLTAWYTHFAKVPTDGEVPVKSVKIPKQRRNRLEPLEYTEQPLYGEWQMKDFEPPIAEDGKVPINSYGNVDLFKMEMLPKGCSYISDPLAWRAAKHLNVRFKFSGRSAVPETKGIVVCSQHEPQILQTLNEIRETIELKNIELQKKKEKREIQRQKKSLQIQQRLDVEREDDDQGIESYIDKDKDQYDNDNIFNN